VIANPPFNVDKEKIKDHPRFPFGMPRSDNANYLWIQLFYSSLNLCFKSYLPVRLKNFEPGLPGFKITSANRVTKWK